MLKAIQGDQKKGKSSSKCQTATDKLQYLMYLNQSITLAMAKTMQHLSHFVFILMATITLVRIDSYLDHLRSGIKQDTLNALRTASLLTATPLKTEEDNAQYENKLWFICSQEGMLSAI